MKRVMSMILVLMLLSVCIVIPASAKAYTGEVNAEAAILVDAGTGEVLYSKNETDKIYPAGTTKLMTALVAYELCPDLNKTFTIDSGAIGDITETNDKTLSPMLSVGESLTMKDLLGGILVGSGNDAATAAAYLTAGSIEKFVSEMNNKAADLSMKGTNFTNPHGRAGEDHYTTAEDMVKLISEIYTKPELLNILEMKSYTIEKGAATTERVISSENRFFDDETSYSNGRGSLGGYTDSAGGCLVSCGEKNGTRMFCAIFGAASPDGAWELSEKLFEYAFGLTVTYTAQEILADVQLNIEKMTVTPDFTDITVEISKYTELKDITAIVELPTDKESDVGSAKYYNGDGTLLAVVPVTVEKDGLPLILKILKVILIIIISLVILFVLFIAAVRLLTIRRKRELARRRAEREERRARRIEEENKPIDLSEFNDL